MYRCLCCRLDNEPHHTCSLSQQERLHILQQWWECKLLPTCNKHSNFLVQLYIGEISTFYVTLLHSFRTSLQEIKDIRSSKSISLPPSSPFTPSSSLPFSFTSPPLSLSSTPPLPHKVKGRKIIWPSLVKWRQLLVRSSSLQQINCNKFCPQMKFSSYDKFRISHNLIIIL